MASKQASSTARRVVGMARAAVVLAVAGAAGLSVSGQAQREWRDYAGGPDSSRFVAATQINKTNVHQLQVAWTYPSGQTDFNPLVVRGPGAFRDVPVVNVVTAGPYQVVLLRVRAGAVVVEGAF